MRRTYALVNHDALMSHINHKKKMNTNTQLPPPSPPSPHSFIGKASNYLPPPNCRFSHSIRKRKRKTTEFFLIIIMLHVQSMPLYDDATRLEASNIL